MKTMRRTIWEARREPTSEEDRLTERFSRRETPEQRAARIARKRLDPAQAAALRRLWSLG